MLVSKRYSISQNNSQKGWMDKLEIGTDAMIGHFVKSLEDMQSKHKQHIRECRELLLNKIAEEEALEQQGALLQYTGNRRQHP